MLLSPEYLELRRVLFLVHFEEIIDEWNGFCLEMGYWLHWRV